MLFKRKINSYWHFSTFFIIAKFGRGRRPGPGPDILFSEVPVPVALYMYVQQLDSFIYKGAETIAALWVRMCVCVYEEKKKKEKRREYSVCVCACV